MGLLKESAKRLLSGYWKHCTGRAEGERLELAFWDRWFRAHGGEWAEDYHFRLDPDAEVQGWHREILASLPDPEPAVLDVGAGPLTAIGKRLDGRRPRITAVDALGARYQDLYRRHGIVPPIPTQQCPGEDLGTQYPPDSFAWVNCQNALDHCADPLVTLMGMLRCCRPGGVVTLWHEEDEAEREHWRGFHKWNLRLGPDGLAIAGRDGRTWRVDRLLWGCRIEHRREGHWIQTRLRREP